MLIRLIITIFAMFAAFVATHAQAYYGFKAGVNLSADYLKALDYQTPTKGPSAALVFKYHNQRVMGTQVELGYGHKGWDEYYSESSYLRGQSTFADAKFLTHAEIGKSAFKGIIDGGPYLSFILNAEEDRILGGVAVEQKFVYGDEMDNRFDYGLSFGGGFLYQLKIGDVFVNANWSLSLSGLTAEISSDNYDFRTNQPLSITFGYLFCPQRLRK